MDFLEEYRKQHEEVNFVVKRKEGKQAFEDLLLVKDEVFKFRFYTEYTYTFEDETGTKSIHICYKETDECDLIIEPFMRVQEILQGSTCSVSDEYLDYQYLQICILSNTKPEK